MSVLICILGIVAAALTGGLTMAFYSHRWNLEPGFGEAAPGKGFVTAVGMVVGAILGALFTICTAANFESNFVTFMSVWSAATVVPVGAVLVEFGVRLSGSCLELCQSFGELAHKHATNDASEPAAPAKD